MRGTLRASITAATSDNLRSQRVMQRIGMVRVMQRIGMVRNPGDAFNHPGLPDGHPLRRHVL
jgi:RimJ/RimL family protein N-acetyltransferase